jgi:hypothetical protein
VWQTFCGVQSGTGEGRPVDETLEAVFEDPVKIPVHDDDDDVVIIIII